MHGELGHWPQPTGRYSALRCRLGTTFHSRTTATASPSLYFFSCFVLHLLIALSMLPGAAARVAGNRRRCSSPKSLRKTPRCAAWAYF